MLELICEYCEKIDWQSKDGRSGSYFSVQVKLPSGKVHTLASSRSFQIGAKVPFLIDSKRLSDGRYHLVLEIAPAK